MEYNKTAKDLIYIVSCAVNKKEPSEISTDDLDLDELYSLACNHFLITIVNKVLLDIGIEDSRFDKKASRSMMNLAWFDIERKKVFDVFDEKGIKHCPLKGIILKDCYPEYGMREMSDNDILCDRTRMADIRNIMEGLGYTCEMYNEFNHDVYMKAPAVCFEMHHDLFEEDNMPVYYSYYYNCFDRLIPAGKYEYHFSDEDFYVYIIAHEYKHFSNRGTGLRSLLDVYMFNKTHTELDRKYISEELEKLDLVRFEEHSRYLSNKLFSFQTLNEDDIDQLSDYLDSTVYGTLKKGFDNNFDKRYGEMSNRKAKAKYLFDRVFINGEALENNYPFFYRHKILLPFLYIYRPFKGLFTHPGEIIRDTKNAVTHKNKKRNY